MLIIRNLKCRYGGITVIKGVSFSVKEGEIVTLIGANGAGKSTLLQAVCGLLPGWEGEIQLDGQSLKSMSPPDIVRRGISLVPEGRLIFSSLTVDDNLKLGAYTMYRKKDYPQIAKNLELAHSLFPVLYDRGSQLAGTLSGGEQQMLAIGRAMMASPKLLLLDEPSMGLAPLLVQKIMQTLTLLRKQGLTILLVEQNAVAALKIADRGYVLETGNVVLQGASADLLNDGDVKRAYLGKDYEEFCEGRE